MTQELSRPPAPPHGAFDHLGYRPPAPIVLPTPGPRESASRFLRGAFALARYTAPEAARLATGRRNGYNPVARALRLACGDLGATYVKFGQFVGSAPDIVGESIAAEFRSCLDSGPPIPFDDVRRTIERDFGRPLRELYADFDETPLAAASIAAVHRARLRSGEDVAVKVLRPGMERLVAADLGVMTLPVRIAAQQGVDRAMDLLGFLVGLREQVAE